MDAGISIETFWNSSYGEIMDMLESCAREEKRRRKDKILDAFIHAEAVAINIAAMFDEKAKAVKPWDYYSKLFAEEKEIFEAEEYKRNLEIYKEERKIYIKEFNRRRKQGLI